MQHEKRIPNNYKHFKYWFIGSWDNLVGLKKYLQI